MNVDGSIHALTELVSNHRSLPILQAVSSNFIAQNGFEFATNFHQEVHLNTSKVSTSMHSMPTPRGSRRLSVKLLPNFRKYKPNVPFEWVSVLLREVPDSNLGLENRYSY
jgi:hypothetical protein